MNDKKGRKKFLCENRRESILNAGCVNRSEIKMEEKEKKEV